MHIFSQLVGMIFTFYKSMGYDVGKSLVEEDMIELAGDLMKKAEAKGVKLVLPTDVVLADKFAEDANSAVAAADSISGDWLGLDIGPDSIDAFAAEITAQNSRKPFGHIVFIHVKLIGVHRALHHCFTQTIGAGDEHHFAES